MKPEVCDSDACQTIPIYQLDTGLCSKYFLCICQETYPCPCLQHGLAEAGEEHVVKNLLWKILLIYPFCYFVFFLSLVTQESSNSSSCDDARVCAQEDHVLSIMLWSKVNPGSHGHGRSCPPLCTALQLQVGFTSRACWSPALVSQQRSFCSSQGFLSAFWGTQMGGKSGWSR